MSAPALSVVRPEHGGGDEGEMRLFELIREWDAFLELSGKAARTRSSYRYMLVRFLADVMMDLRSITEREILDHLRTLDPHGGKRGDIIRALKSFFGWAVKREHVRINPVVDIRIPRPRDGRAPRPTQRPPNRPATGRGQIFDPGWFLERCRQKGVRALWILLSMAPSVR